MALVPGKKSKLVFSLLPEVADLPQSLTPEHKTYCNDFIGEPFQAHVGPQGKKSSNARTWTQELFAGPFCNKIYPTVSQETRAQYELILGPAFYSYLTNHSARGSSGVKSKSQVVVQRVYGHDVWRHENHDVLEKVLDEYRDNNPHTPITIGLRRLLTIDLFRKLPADEQSKYRDKASNCLKGVRALQVLSGEDRSEYTKRFQVQLRALFKEAEERAGLKINSQILYEDEDGDFHLTTLIMDCMVELAESEEVEQLIARMRGWVKETAIYPHYEHDMYRRPPPLIGLRAVETQKILPFEFSLLWGGCGRFPWELICAQLDNFMHPECRPEGAILGDPSNLRSSMVLKWLEYFHAFLDPNFPLHRRTQFLKVFGGLKPIDPALSQESLRRWEFIPSQNREGWVLFLTKPVTRNHAPNGLEYPPESITYANYLKPAAQVHSTKDTDKPELPLGNTSSSAPLHSQDAVAVPSTSSHAHPLANAPSAMVSSSTIGDSSSKRGSRSDKRNGHQILKRSNTQNKLVPESDSEESDTEKDYEILDCHSDEEDGIDPDGYLRDSDNSISLSCNSSPLPHFGDECSEMLCAAFSEPSQHHSFGAFHPLPPVSIQPLPRSYEPLHASLSDTVGTVESTLHDWGELARMHGIWLNRKANSIVATVGELPTPLQPLAYLALACARTWECTQGVASLVIDFVPRLILTARAALQLDVAVEEFLEEEECKFTVGNMEYVTLSKLRNRLLKGGIELCWTYKELLASKSLLLEWSQRFPSGFGVDGATLANVPALYNLAQCLVEWANVSTKLDQDLRAQRRIMWRPACRLFEARHHALLWYWFGNPSAHEMPEGFEGMKIFLKIILLSNNG
ncbi:hypothetical protein RHS03_08684, partial [Rhizoctonia solani]